MAKAKVYHPKTDARKHSRRIVHQRCSVSVSAENPLNDKQKDIPGTLLDVSNGGFGICTNKSIPIDSLVLAEVRATGFTQIFHCRVAWCEAIPSSGKVLKPSVNGEMNWRMGLELIDKDPTEKQLLAKLVTSL